MSTMEVVEGHTWHWNHEKLADIFYTDSRETVYVLYDSNREYVDYFRTKREMMVHIRKESR